MDFIVSADNQRLIHEIKAYYFIILSEYSRSPAKFIQ